MRLHSRPTVATASLAAALVALAGCGNGEGAGTDTTSASSSATYDDEYAFAEAEKIQPEWVTHHLNEPLPKDTVWATPQFIKTFNDQLAAFEEAGATQKGKVTTTGIHPGESRPDAAGGWNLTMYSCSTSTVRLYKDGKDVTARPEDPTKPLPKGPQENVNLLSFTTPDDGKTWQLDRVQLIYGDEAEETPCAS